MQSPNTVPLANFGNQVAYQAQATVKLSVHPQGKKIPPPVAPKPVKITRATVRFKSAVDEDANKENDKRESEVKSGNPIYDQVKIRRPSSETNGEVKPVTNEYTSTGYAVPKLHLKQNRRKSVEDETNDDRKKSVEEERSESKEPRKQKSIEEELDELESLAKAAHNQQNHVANIPTENDNERDSSRARSKSIEDELAELQELTDLLEMETSKAKKEEPPAKTETQNAIQNEQPKEEPKPKNVGLEGKKDVGDVAGELDELTNMLLQGLDGAAQEENFVGMCFTCKQKITGGGGCSAMGKTYHIDCFTCGKCKETKLVGKEFYVVEDVPHCDVCYKDTLEECALCMQKITDRVLHAVGCSFHPECFKCCACSKMLDTLPFMLDEDKQPHCVDCYQQKYSPRCAMCEKIILSQNEKGETTPHIVSMQKHFHVDCYKCEDCGLMLSSEIEGHGCYPLNGHLYCLNCNGKRLQEQASRS